MEAGVRRGLAGPASAERRAFWEKAVPIVIGALVLMDAVLAGIILISGQTWFDLMHGTDQVDPGGYLKRTGALWLSFAIIEAIAFVRWREAPHWLMVLAGVRWGDVLSDWTWWGAMDDRTWLAHVLLLATPANVLLGLFFFRAYFVFRDRDRDRGRD
jgi:hypothetical protein